MCMTNVNIHDISGVIDIILDPSLESGSSVVVGASVEGKQVSVQSSDEQLPFQ